MSLEIRRLMNKEVIRVQPDTTVAKLDRILTGYGISGAPVVDDAGVVVGIVSQTDIVRLLSGAFEGGVRQAVGREALEATTVEEIMERRVHFVRPDDDIAEAASQMRHLGIHRVPVLDENRRVVGILSALDLVRVVEDFELFDEYYSLRKRSQQEA